MKERWKSVIDNKEVDVCVDLASGSDYAWIGVYKKRSDRKRQLKSKKKRLKKKWDKLFPITAVLVQERHYRV
jgi:hypothetical protein